MLYAKIENNQVVQIAALQSLFPNTSFPATGPDAETLIQLSILPVLDWQEHNRDEVKLVMTEPTINGNSVVMFQLVPLTEEEKAQRIQEKLDTQWSVIKEQRSRLLSSSDWTQLPDSPLSLEKKTEWAVYRQALRDITTLSDINNIVWPTQPGA